MTAYYNEHDTFAAQWLRNLIAGGHIAPGDVDERSIEDVRPSDLTGYTQCHFFAGIGVWSFALRRAGWPDDQPVWTGSCPCQPFSTAGKAGGFADERHLWPAFYHLIGECKPPVVFGEQVASKDGLAWLDLVHADMEAAGYAVGAVDLSAAGVGAPHIRQRLWFVGDLRLGHPECEGLEGHSGHGDRASGREEPSGSVTSAGEFGGLADPSHGAGHGSEPRAVVGLDAQGAGTVQAQHGNAGPTNGFWRNADWLLCRDGKWRPVEPGTFPLAHGSPSRVGRLRGYGNAIVAPVAEEFIKAYLITNQE